MSYKVLYSILLTGLLFVPLPLIAQNKDSERETLVNHLKNTGVTIRAESRFRKSEGSGVIITRTLKTEQGKAYNLAFVWTAGHVIRSLRKQRIVTDSSTGTDKKVIEFGRPQIVKELIDPFTGQRTGEIKLDTVVLCYSNSETGEDLALLLVLERQFVKFREGAKFYLKNKIPSVGVPVCHMGSRHGQFGHGSFSSGEISSIGRVFKEVSYKIFDQTSVPASPGSSGGGVFVKWGSQDVGKCLGLVVRGGESTFNFIVPIRRMRSWAKKMNITWALDESVKTPLIEELKNITVEDGWVGKKNTSKSKRKSLKFLLKITEDTTPQDPREAIRGFKALKTK